VTVAKAPPPSPSPTPSPGSSTNKPNAQGVMERLFG
jgi:hypothetical protein